MINKFLVFMFIAVQGFIVLVLLPDQQPALMAGGVDVETTKENSYISVFSQSDGDHVLRLDNTNTNLILHHYKVSQMGTLEYKGFRNLTVDYAVAGRLNLSGKGSVAAATPEDLLKMLTAVFAKDDVYKVWLEAQKKDMTKAEKSAAKKDKLKFPLMFCSTEGIFKKPEKGALRMITIDSQTGVNEQRLMIMDHTNKTYLVYGLNPAVGVNLMSSRKFFLDEQIAYPEASDLLLLNFKKAAATSQDMEKFLKSLQKIRSKPNAKPIRTHNK